MIYKEPNTQNISFPLGGIGTGCIGLAGNGELREFEIFNRPAKNIRNGYSHFAIKATCGDKSVTKILQGDTCENLMGTPCASTTHHGFGYGPEGASLAGLPHFEEVVFEGVFPIARLTFQDRYFPIVARLSAFNPLIPHDAYNSSIPAAFFEWEVENVTDVTVDVALACTLRNAAASSANQIVSKGKINGIFFGSEGIEHSDIEYSDLCLLTDSADFSVQKYWYRGGWQDGCTMYWNNFTKLDRMPTRNYEASGCNDHGTVVSYISVPAGEKAKIRFVMSWNVPNAYNYWKKRAEGEALPTWRNYYATVFEDSFSSGSYALENFALLYEKTLKFTNALQDSTLSDAVKDAISANLSVLKTPTALRLEDGSFWGWEGCTERSGSCHGTCQHVWNYAYAMPYLFPRLERSIRENTMKYAMLDSGATTFRVDLPPQKVRAVWRSCVDGQMGEVIKCYREWKFSGDTDWLRANSESIFKMLEYAWSKDNPDKWDADMDGVLEGRQHHTLDMELFGPSSWLQGFYLLALDCGAKMAEALGDVERADLYTRLYKNGKDWTNENLFNGAYFYQKINLSDKSIIDAFEGTDRYWNAEANEIKYQVAEGCIIDQLLADWHAALIGMEGVFETTKKKIALENLYKNNFKTSMREIVNLWRNFSLDDEAGTLICTYPDGVTVPAIPIPYCEETMTGFEYALAGLMIAEGFVSEGESMIKAVRDRYDGAKRNPWNEMECGSNYARSMASFALMAIYSGFSYDMTEKRIGFAPISEGGQYLFSAAESWGTIAFDDDRIVLSVLGNPLELNEISVPNANTVTCVTVDGTDVDFTTSGGRIVLGKIKIQKELFLK
ncbi:MAG: hypothetical protein IKV00_04005 [Clostridia bacterium]|nr:hypothetical protein [Clostridia bacterium]